MICREQDPAVVAVRIVVVAAVVGWLVLFWQGSALAAEDDEIQALAGSLVETRIKSEQERLESARESLTEARNERIVRLHEEMFESSWRAWTGASPRRLLSGARDIASELWDWRDRSPAEDVALDWLEVGGPESILDPEARDLYESLRQRERRKQADEIREGADWALSKGYTSLARVRIERLLELDPASKHGLELYERLEAATAPAPGAAQLIGDLSAEPWEAPVAAALLSEDYARVQDLAPESASGSFARAIAEFLAGKPDDAVASLEPLREREDDIGRLANEWVEHHDLSIEETFAQRTRDYRIRQVLGMLGGDQLSQSGVELSPRGYRAWRESMTPLNVAVSMPARFYRGWKPDGEELREAALQYIAQLPKGPRAAEAVAWLQDIQPGDRAQARFAGWDGDRFTLPPARTVYPRLTPMPVLVTKRVLDSIYVSDVPGMRDSLGLGDAVLLEARHPEEGEDGLDPESARRFLIELAFAIEQGKLDPMSRTPEATLDAIRRLESALVQGQVLVAEPTDIGSPELWGGLSRALVDGQDQQIGALAMQRGEDDFRVVRQFGQASLVCPSYALCVDRERFFGGALYGQLDSDSELQLGLQTNLRDAHFAIGLTESGPAVSMVLPIGRWLGVGRWLPIAAYVGVSADSFYVGPAFVR
jgi:hypothetical protein